MIKEEFYKALEELEASFEDALLDNSIKSRDRFVDAINLMNVVTDDCYATLEELDHQCEYEVFDE